MRAFTTGGTVGFGLDQRAIPRPQQQSEPSQIQNILIIGISVFVPILIILISVHFITTPLRLMLAIVVTLVIFIAMMLVISWHYKAQESRVWSTATTTTIVGSTQHNLLNADRIDFTRV